MHAMALEGNAMDKDIVVKEEASDEGYDGLGRISIRNEPLEDTETSDSMLDTTLETLETVDTFMTSMKEETVDEVYDFMDTSSQLPPAVINIAPTGQMWQPKEKDNKYLKINDRRSRSSAIMPTELPQAQSRTPPSLCDSRQGQLWDFKELRKEMTRSVKSPTSTSAFTSTPKRQAVVCKPYVPRVHPVLIRKVPTLGRPAPIVDSSISESTSSLAPDVNAQGKVVVMPRYTNERRQLIKSSKVRAAKQSDKIIQKPIPPKLLQGIDMQPFMGYVSDSNETLEEYLSSGSNEMSGTSKESNNHPAKDFFKDVALAAATAVQSQSSGKNSADHCSSTDEELVQKGGASVPAKNTQQFKEWNETEHILSKIKAIQERLFSLDSSCLADKIVSQNKLSQWKRSSDYAPTLTDYQEAKGIYKFTSEQRRRDARVIEVNMLKSERNMLLKRARFLVKSHTEKERKSQKPGEDTPKSPVKPVIPVKASSKPGVKKLSMAQLLQKKRKEVDQLINAAEPVAADQLKITDIRPPKKRKHFLVIKEEPVDSDDDYGKQEKIAGKEDSPVHDCDETIDDVELVDNYRADLVQSIKSEEEEEEEQADGSEPLVIDIEDSDNSVEVIAEDAAKPSKPSARKGKLSLALIKRVKHLKTELEKIDIVNNENPFHEGEEVQITAISAPPPLPARLLAPLEKPIDLVTEQKCHFLWRNFSCGRKSTIIRHIEFSSPEQYISAVYQASHLQGGLQNTYARLYLLWNYILWNMGKWRRLLRDSKYPLTVRACARHCRVIDKPPEFHDICDKCGEYVVDSLRKNTELLDSPEIKMPGMKEEAIATAMAFYKLHGLQLVQHPYLCLLCINRLVSCHLCTRSSSLGTGDGGNDELNTVKTLFARNGQDVANRDAHLVVDAELYQKLNFKGTLDLSNLVCEACFREIECHVKLSPVPLKPCSVRIRPLPGSQLSDCYD